VDALDTLDVAQACRSLAQAVTAAPVSSAAPHVPRDARSVLDDCVEKPTVARRYGTPVPLAGKAGTERLAALPCLRHFPVPGSADRAAEFRAFDIGRRADVPG
jgi:hypothetical protein